mmetsp:Transcript_11890/g.17354  ORF Transcript_11890/g.17354 Transcript_11890/m.17354 type:complete len:307 (-) Transcript_11890:303-1223(-)
MRRSSQRTNRASIAQETLKILECGEYDNPQLSDEKISIAEDLQQSSDSTVVVDTATSTKWQHKITPKIGTNGVKTLGPVIRIMNTTTFAAAREISLRDNIDDVCCLNFASAKHPGGGFKGGSQAQEESLARASGLYSCLLKAPQYYTANKKNKNPLYRDLIIYSPRVPVFRDDNDALIAQSWKTAIITAPAPNRGAVLQIRPSDAVLIEETFVRRIDMILSTAGHFGHRHLVLGAWGCGVFQNEPRDVAKLFRNALMKSCFDGAFDSVTFAVLDWSKDKHTVTSFEEVFADIAAHSHSSEEAPFDK